MIKKYLHDCSNNREQLENKVKNILEPLLYDYIYQGYDIYELNIFIQDIIYSSTKDIYNELLKQYEPNKHKYSEFQKLVKIDNREFEKYGNIVQIINDNLIIQMEDGFIPKYPFNVYNEEKRTWVVYYTKQ